ncbi:hypothetical protein L3Q82_012914, partial [Scortum barcoo]
VSFQRQHDAGVGFLPEEFQPHLPAQAMVRRELPKHQRDLIVQRYQSGEGYKRISKELNIPWNHSEDSHHQVEKIWHNSDITKNRTSVQN